MILRAAWVLALAGLVIVANSSLSGFSMPTAHAAATVNLPPALQAAINSGDPNAISRTIATLSAGNPVRAIGLIDQTLYAAEGMLTTSPALGIKATLAAAQGAEQPSVCAANAAQCFEVVTTIARIANNMTVRRVDPANSIAIAKINLDIAAHTQNASLIGVVATEALNLAEALLSIVPASAVGLSLDALTNVSFVSNVLQPQVTLTAVLNASRVAVSGIALSSSPSQCASIGRLVMQMLEKQVIYQASPVAAQAAMSNAARAIAMSGM
jgi:hypothetical protein